MSDGMDYSDEDMEILTKAPSKMGHAVMIASRTRFFGANREMRAMEEAIMDLEDFGDNGLIKGIVDEARAEMKREGWHRELRKRREEYHRETIGLCGEVKGILRKDEEGEGFKRWLLHVGENVARAFPTDEFMGIGGVVISREEKNLLKSVAEALGVTDYHIEREPTEDRDEGH